MSYVIFTSKLIGNEKNTLKYFITFNIIPCEPLFRIIIESQIAVSQHNLFSIQIETTPDEYCNVIYFIISS